MKQITNLMLNLNDDNNSVVFAKQFDRNSRFLHIQLCNDGEIFPLDNTHAVIIINKLDNTQVVNNCNIIDNNIIEVEITYQMLSVQGITQAEIILYDNNSNVVTSGIFFFDIRKSLYNNNNIESSNEYNALIDALSVASTLGDTVTDAYNLSNKNKNNIDDIKEKLADININKADKSDLGNISCGTPLVAENTEDMTDTQRMYVNTSDGMIYAYLNNKWQSTGIIYQSTGIASKSIDKSKLTDDIIECRALMPLRDYCRVFNASIASSASIYNYNTTSSAFVRYNDNSGIGHFKIIKDTTSTAYAPYFGVYSAERFITFNSDMVMYVSADITGNGVTAKLQYRYLDENKSSISAVQARDFFKSGEITMTLSDEYKEKCRYIEIVGVMMNSTTESGSIDMYNFKAYRKDDINDGSNLSDVIDRMKTTLEGTQFISDKLNVAYANKNLNANSSEYNNTGEILYLFDGNNIITVSEYSISNNCYINSKSLKTNGKSSRTYNITVDKFDISEDDYIGVYANVSRSDIEKIGTMNISFKDSSNNDICKIELGSWNLQNGWYLYKSKAASSGTVSKIVIAFYSAEDITVYLDSVVKNRKSKSKILLCFDNWSKSLLDTYNILSQYNFKGTFCISDGNTHKLFEDMYNTLINNNWDIAYYNGYGDRPEDTDSQEKWDKFICNGMNNLIYNGCKKPTAYFCRWNKSTDKIINSCKKAGFKMLRMSHSNYYINDYNYDSFEIPCVQILNKNIDTVKSYIDNAIKRGSSLSIFAHQILSDDVSTSSDNTNVNISTYTALLDYIKSKIDNFEVEVVTYKEFYNSVYNL